MAELLFENEIKQLMKLGVHKDLAILTASYKLEDKTIYYKYLAKMKEENDLIEKHLQLMGFKKSTDIIEDEPITKSITDENKDI
jgi:hypothetical protein